MGQLQAVAFAGPDVDSGQEDAGLVRARWLLMPSHRRTDAAANCSAVSSRPRPSSRSVVTLTAIARWAPGGMSHDLICAA